MLRFGIACFVALIICAAAFSFSTQAEIIEPVDEKGYILHEPIRVDGEKHFSDYGFPGDGSESNPWLIENYEINGTNDDYGIFIWSRDEHFIIRNNRVINSERTGIMLYYSNNGTINNNEVSNNNWSGIQLLGSNNINITGNAVLSNKDIGILVGPGPSNGTRDGTESYMTNNNIINNHIENNNIGISYSGYAGGTRARTILSEIRDNNITNNEIGLQLWYNHTLVYHNNFINNTQQAMNNYGSYFDNGYPDGGNYWSGFGIDRFSGPDQDQNGSDGIADDPYPIRYQLANQDYYVMNIDYYPLMEPWPPIPDDPEDDEPEVPPPDPEPAPEPEQIPEPDEPEPPAFENETQPDHENESNAANPDEELEGSPDNPENITLDPVGIIEKPVNTEDNSYTARFYFPASADSDYSQFIKLQMILFGLFLALSIVKIYKLATRS